MKKSKFILGVIAAAAFVAITGCDGLTIKDPYEIAAGTVLNTFTCTGDFGDTITAHVRSQYGSFSFYKDDGTLVAEQTGVTWWDTSCSFVDVASLTGDGSLTVYLEVGTSGGDATVEYYADNGGFTTNTNGDAWKFADDFDATVTKDGDVPTKTAGHLFEVTATRAGDVLTVVYTDWGDTTVEDHLEELAL